MRKNNRQHNEQTAYDLLIEHIEKTKSELDCAYSKFENATDPDLIDSSIYLLQSIQMRYKFLLKCAKRSDPSISQKP